MMMNEFDQIILNVPRIGSNKYREILFELDYDIISTRTVTDGLCYRIAIQTIRRILNNQTNHYVDLLEWDESNLKIHHGKHTNYH